MLQTLPAIPMGSFGRIRPEGNCRLVVQCGPSSREDSLYIGHICFFATEIGDDNVVTGNTYKRCFEVVKCSFHQTADDLGAAGGAGALQPLLVRAELAASLGDEGLDGLAKPSRGGSRIRVGSASRLADDGIDDFPNSAFDLIEELHHRREEALDAGGEVIPD